MFKSFPIFAVSNSSPKWRLSVCKGLNDSRFCMQWVLRTGRKIININTYTHETTKIKIGTETMTSEEKIEQMKALASRVMPQDGEVWLFGSRARGTANADSDWDILVLLDTDHVTFEDYSRYGYPFMALGWDIDAMISPIVYTKKDWERSSFTPFYKNVMQERVAIWA